MSTEEPIPVVRAYDVLDFHLGTLAGLASLLSYLLADEEGGMVSEREHRALADAVKHYAAEAEGLAAGVLDAHRREVGTA